MTLIFNLVCGATHPDTCTSPYFKNPQAETGITLITLTWTASTVGAVENPGSGFEWSEDRLVSGTKHQRVFWVNSRHDTEFHQSDEQPVNMMHNLCIFVTNTNLICAVDMYFWSTCCISMHCVNTDIIMCMWLHIHLEQHVYGSSLKCTAMVCD